MASFSIIWVECTTRSVVIMSGVWWQSRGNALVHSLYLMSVLVLTYICPLGRCGFYDTFLTDILTLRSQTPQTPVCPKCCVPWLEILLPLSFHPYLVSARCHSTSIPSDLTFFPDSTDEWDHCVSLLYLVWHNVLRIMLSQMTEFWFSKEQTIWHCTYIHTYWCTYEVFIACCLSTNGNVGWVHVLSGNPRSRIAALDDTCTFRPF